MVLVVAVAGVLAVPKWLTGQTAASGSASGVPLVEVSAAAPAAPWLAPPAALPSSLTPAAAGADGSISIQEGEGPLPYLFGIFGGIAGMFVGDWWADRECGSDCGAGKIAMLFLSGGLGAMIGWVIGGGEIPQPPPGR
jgi:hypothetical protein